jgi:hypothetical protein
MPLLIATQMLKVLAEEGVEVVVVVEEEEEVVLPCRLFDSGRQRTKPGRCPIRLPTGVCRRATGVARLLLSPAAAEAWLLLSFSSFAALYIAIVVDVTVMTHSPLGVYAQRIPPLPDIP